MSTLKTRALAALTAVAALAMTAGGAAVANAENAPTANINPEAAVSVIFHKYDKTGATAGDPAYDKTNNGLKLTDTSKLGSPVANVQFKLTEVQARVEKEGEPKTFENKTIDLSTSEGWKLAADLKSDPTEVATNFYDESKNPTGKYVKSDTTLTSDNTGADGTVTVNGQTGTGLNMRVYYVEELIDGNETVNGNKVSITDGIKPFLITVPMKNVDTATQKETPWLYTINVYPKNDTSSKVPTKTATVNDKAVSTMEKGADGYTAKANGASVDWTVSFPLTAQKPGATSYTKVGFSDKFADGIEFVDVTDVKLVPATEDGSITGDNLTAADYEIEYWVPTSAEDPTLKKADAKPDDLKTVKAIRFNLTEAGLAKAFANKGQMLSAVVKTKVSNSGATTNKAKTWVDDTVSGGPDDPSNPPTDPTGDGTPEDTVYFANLKITKTDSKTELPLNGAEFAVYAVKDGQTVDEGDYTKDELDGKIDLVGGQGTDKDNFKSYTTLTTGKLGTEEGVATANLFTVKSSDKAAALTRTFCVLETGFPEGYKDANASKPYKCKSITATESASTSTVSWSITNAPEGITDKIADFLPATGATGLVVMTAMGALLIGAGVFAVAGARRREQE